MNRVRLPFVLLVAGGLLAPSAASSQTAPEPLTVAAAEMPATAMTAAEQLRPSAGAAALFTFAPVQEREPFRLDAARQIDIDVDDNDDGGVPFMIGGGILFIAGAIAGGDAGTILMLGGAAAGAYGAFVYFGGD